MKIGPRISGPFVFERPSDVFLTEFESLVLILADLGWDMSPQMLTAKGGAALG